MGFFRKVEIIINQSCHYEKSLSKLRNTIVSSLHDAPFRFVTNGVEFTKECFKNLTFSVFTSFGGKQTLHLFNKYNFGLYFSCESYNFKEK